MSYDFERFFDHSLDMFCIANTKGEFLRINSSFQQALGWTTEELTSQHFVHFIHPEDVDASLGEVEKLARGIPTTFFQNRYRCADGSYKQLQWTAFPEPETGLLFAVARDTTELMKANERFWMVFNSSPAAMILVDARGRINLLNEKSEDLFGYSREELLGELIERLVPDRFRGAHTRHRTDFFQAREPRPMGAGRHLTAISKQGIEFPVEIGLNPVRIHGEDLVLSSIVDLTVQKQLEKSLLEMTEELKLVNAKLAELASTDELTGLRNRRVFDEQLNAHLKLMRRMGSSLSLLMIDIDRFKHYNDRYGHPAGDQLLASIAKVLVENCRASDVVARYGGEEFAIILPDTTEAGAKEVGEKLREAVEGHAWDTGTVSISVGASTLAYREGTGEIRLEDQARILSSADRALYRSKRLGRNRTTHYSDIENLEEMS